MLKPARAFSQDLAPWRRGFQMRHELGFHERRTAETALRFLQDR